MENAIVSLKRCDEYNFEDIKKRIQEIFNDLGGIDRYIQKGDKVLLKLNLLMMKKPEEAVTTHPVFTKALAVILKEYGAEVIIGDSPGGPFNQIALKGIYKACGMEELAEDIDVQLNYNTNAVELDNPEGLLLKRITAIEVLSEVDKVISVSKLKTHGMMRFTGAVKNMFGIVAGLEKAEYHVRMPNNKDFSNALVDICVAAKPILSFMDGIVGMEGEGPSGGKPRKIGAIIGANSPYHLDVVATSLISLAPNKVPTIERCVERGLCKGSFEDITLLGESPKSFLIEDFEIPDIRSLDLLDGKVPKFLRDILNNLMQPKPLFDHKICVGCGECATSCPPKIIDMIDRKPIVDLDGCIRCFCCQELCPVKAVTIHRPMLMKLMSRL